VTSQAPFLRDYDGGVPVKDSVPTIPPGVVVKVMAIGYQLPGRDEWSQVVIHADAAFTLGFENGSFVGPDPNTAEFVGEHVGGYVPSAMLSDPKTWVPASF